MININDVEIEHSGVVKTIGDMIVELKTGHASYHHWHAVFTKTVKGKSIGLLETEIANGVYDKDRLVELVKMYEFLFIGED
jgi:hypothetical protein